MKPDHSGPDGGEVPVGRPRLFQPPFQLAVPSFWSRVAFRRAPAKQPAPAHPWLHPREARPMAQQSGLRWPEYLGARLAATQAVRAWCRARGVPLPAPARVELAKEASGCPWAVVHSGAQRIVLPISVTHSEGVAVAVVMDPGWRPGLDVQGHRGRDLAFMYRAMSDQDIALLVERAGLPPEKPARLRPWGRRGAALLTFWTAKEAATKALGRGLVPGPRAYAVERWQGQRLWVRCPGRAHRVGVRAARLGAHAWGFALVRGAAPSAASLLADSRP